MPSYDLFEEGCLYDTIEADSIEEALEIACDNVDRSAYDSEPHSTLYVDICVVDEETGEQLDKTVVCAPDEPECVYKLDSYETKEFKSHDWQSPQETLGGCDQNPGVWGSGGGVIINEVCMNCGCKKTTDTWAQNPSNGEQGFTSVEYQPGYYKDEIDAMNEESEE